MRRSTTTLIALLLLSSTGFAGSFRVHYSIRGSGRDIAVEAEPSGEARCTVIEIFDKRQPDQEITPSYLLCLRAISAWSD